MKRSFEIYPCCKQRGVIEVPDEVDNVKDIEQYIFEHWGEAILEEPELNYADADLSIRFTEKGLSLSTYFGYHLWETHTEQRKENDHDE